MSCIFDEPLEPYWCEADWNCKDCPNWIDGLKPQESADTESEPQESEE